MTYRAAVIATIMGLVLAASPSFAGQVYGTVVSDSGPLAGANVSVSCPGAAAAARSTDASGSYSVYVNSAGVCRISVNGKGSLEIRVYNDEVRYDLYFSATGALSRR